MRITCPSCAAEYDIPGELAAGRVVRCAKCGTEWAPVALPQIEPPEEPAPASVGPEADAPLVPMAPPPPATPRRLPLLLLAWIGSAAVLVGALAAALLLREPIMRAWPPSQRVYTALHLRAAGSSDVHGDVVKEPGR